MITQITQPGMGVPRYAAAGLAALAWLTLNATAATILDDTWTDGSRDEQNLPTESQWFSSGGTDNLTNNAPGSMLFIADPTGSRSAITYFATNGLPITLADGENLTLTLDFYVNGVAENEAQSMRFALADYSAGGRVDADDGSSGLNGENVTGYGFFTHVSSLVQRETLDIKERTGIATPDLLGSSSAWQTTLGEGWDLNFTGFQNSTPYTMTFSVTRSGSAAIVTNTLTGGGLDITAAGTNEPGWFSFDAFAFRNSGADETAESFTFTRLLVEGPVGTPSPPSIVVQPQDLTRTLGQAAEFSIAASGGQPLSYQWYYTTNSVDSVLAGETTNLVSIPSVAYDDGGGYFVVVSNTVGTITSDVATLTVLPPDPTPPGLVLEDDFTDEDRLTGPVSVSNSVWYASAPTSLEEWPGYLRGLPNSSSSRLWIGYLTEDPLVPVELAVGTAMKVTLDFTPGAVVDAGTSRALRIGLFDYSTGGTRVTGDSFGSGSSGNGEGVYGYMFNCNFSDPFGADAFAEIRARTGTSSGNLLGTTGVWTELGEGPSGNGGLTGFQTGVAYTLEMTVSRIGSSEMEVTYRMQGGSIDLEYGLVDATYPVNRFDAIGIRADRSTNTADAFDFTNLRVEVVAGAVPPPSVEDVQISDTELIVTWTDPSGTFGVESAGSLEAAGGTAWADAGLTPVETNGQQQVTVPLAEGAGEAYYRLSN